jgi:ABC-type transporter MlaC component
LYNGIIIGVSAGGALTSLINKWFAVGATSIIAVITIIKAALPNLIQTEEELSELDRLMDYYNQYLNKLENLWYNFYSDKINEQEMMKLLFSYKDEECNKSSVLNKGIRALSEVEQKKIDEQCREYINRVYFTKD